MANEEMKYKIEKGSEPEMLPVSFFSNKTTIEVEEEEILWIRKGLLIRIGNETIGNGKYLNNLGVIDEVIDDFGAQVTILKSGDQLLLDQDDCLPVSKVSDEEFDQQLSTIDSRIMSTALKSDRCVLLLNSTDFKGKEGRIMGIKDEEFKVELVGAGGSQIHRKQLNLIEGQFCIYWE